MQEHEKAAKSFLSVMDMSITKGCFNLSDDAILDWFGRTIQGRRAIKQFLLVHFTRMHHTARSIASIEPVTHRLLSPEEDKVTNHVRVSRVEIECGQGDVRSKVTPDRPIRLNYKELVRAPSRLTSKPCKVTRPLQFVEVMGKLETEDALFDGSSLMSETRIKRIVLGINDEGDVNFIMYERHGMSCKGLRKQLFLPHD